MPSTTVARIMSRAEFLIVPSECYENFPLVAAEAFSLGLPVIASRLGSLAEIVRDGVNGISFTAGNTAELRKKSCVCLPIRSCASASRKERMPTTSRSIPRR